MINKQRFAGLCLLIEAGGKNFTIINNAGYRQQSLFTSVIITVLL